MSEKEAQQLLENNGYRIERMSTRPMCSNFTVSGGPLSASTEMGWHITTDGGATVAVSCDGQFAKISAMAPRMAKTLLRLMYHYHRGDELKDFASDIYARVEEAFESKDWDALSELFEQVCEW